MKEISIFFTAADSWYSKLLRWMEGSEVSHVGIEYESKDFEGTWLMEACSKGIVTIPMDNSRKGVLYSYKCDYDASKGLLAASKHVGKKYDYKGSFILGAYFIFKKIFKRIRKPFYSTERRKCSELLVDFIKADIPDIINIDKEWVTPQTVLNICKNNPNSFVKED